MKILCLLGFVTQQRGMIQNSFFVVPEWGRRPITKSVEFFFCIIHGVKIWGFKILAQKSEVPLNFIGYWTNQNRGLFSTLEPKACSFMAFRHARGTRRSEIVDCLWILTSICLI